MAVDVSKLPPPGKIGRGLPAPGEPDGDEYGNDDDRAAEVSQCQDVLDAIKAGDAEQLCEAMKAFLATAKV